MTQGWMKFALQGSTYARALQNAATSGGRALSPAMTSKLTQMRSQPQAQLQPGLGQMFREHAGGGELPMTPQISRMQNLSHQLPWAGEEHGGLPSAEKNFNRTLESRGLVQNTPKGQPNVQQRIDASFGDPDDFRRSLYRADQPQAPASPQTSASGPSAMRALSTPPATPAAAAPPPRQFPRARFQMGKVGSFRTGLEALVEAL